MGPLVTDPVSQPTPMHVSAGEHSSCKPLGRAYRTDPESKCDSYTNMKRIPSPRLFTVLNSNHITHITLRPSLWRVPANISSRVESQHPQHAGSSCSPWQQACQPRVAPWPRGPETSRAFAQVNFKDEPVRFRHVEKLISNTAPS